MGETETAAGPQTTARPISKLVFYIPFSTACATLLLLSVAVVAGWLGEGSHVGSEFGEASRTGLIKQPANTFSSFAFVFAGLFAAWRLVRRPHDANTNSLTRNTSFSAFFLSLLVCLGPGSMALHATETRLGGNLDLLAMYFVAAFLTAFGVKRFFQLNRAWFSLLFVTVVVICVLVQDLPYSIPFVGNFGDFIFGLFIVVGSLFEALNSYVRKMNHDFRWGALSLGILVFALCIWNLTRHRRPSYSLIQGHAIWHLLCALSTYCLFRYYASQRPRPGIVTQRTSKEVR